ncbi:MAG TPA: cytochrome c oxidase assembly protein [Gemmatimonadaceae bacterium]|nr:cytochrome c oxidase assembly protein [Gemmatimonadaceae bacterium]
MLLHAGAGAVGWTDWDLEPGVVVPVLLAGILYARGWRRPRATHRSFFRRHAPVWFWLAEVLVLLALVSPLDGFADALFSAHMAQHLVLILVVAPLYVLGEPVIPVLRGLPRRARTAAVRAWHAVPGARAAWHVLLAPGVVFTVHMAAIWFWHFPGPYQAALGNDAVHALEHLSFLGTAVLFWWLVMQPTGRRRLGYGQGLFFVGATLIQGGALGALLMWSSTPWYPAHAASTLAMGVSPLADQQLAGLLMWIPPGFLYIGAACGLFLAWLRDDDAKSSAAHAWRSSNAVA